MNSMKDKAVVGLPFIDSNDPNNPNNCNNLIQPTNLTLTNNTNLLNDCSDPNRATNLTLSNNNNLSNRINDSVRPFIPSNDITNLETSTTTNNSQSVKEGQEQSKKEKKEKSNKSQWRKEKGNKYLNKPYRNYKGIEIKSKEFVDYDCKCQMKCKEVLSAMERKLEFEKFWELGSYEAQAIFLIARVDEQVTKKSTKKKKDKYDSDDLTEPASPSAGDSKKSKRQFSRTYILKSKQVCRNMFVKTLGITSKRINTALVKMRSKSLSDHRGLSQGGKNKISDKRYDEVVDHIKKMPRYKCSHIQGKFNSDLLPPELSLSKMYELYTKEVGQPVSLSMYKKIYYGKFNFKVKGAKKEICNICKGERKLKSENLKKQQARERHQIYDEVPPACEVIIHEHYRPPNFMNSSPIHYNQTWFPSSNFQIPQHNPGHYFEQPMNYEKFPFQSNENVPICD